MPTSLKCFVNYFREISHGNHLKSNFTKCFTEISDGSFAYGCVNVINNFYCSRLALHKLILIANVEARAVLAYQLL